jgi:hypothetical protein
VNKFVVIEKNKKIRSALFLLAAFLIFGSATGVFAHGGEDHGDSKPQTTVGEKGTVSHTARLGSLEVMVKHSVIEPDVATAARLFITDFKTNAPADKISPAVEIESASGGSIIPVVVEKSDSPGSFNLKIPALTAGSYTLRANVTYSGETDTATFSGVQVENAPVVSAESSGSWTRGGLMILSGLIVLGLFSGMIYYGIRAAKSRRTREEAVSV